MAAGDAPDRGARVPDDRSVAVLGVGMHPWGKWGRNFVEYGLAAARDALADAGVAWTDVQFVSGADTIRNGYPGFISGATFAQALGWSGARVSSAYAACASGATAIAAARAQILAGLCDVALVVGADTTPKGFFAPVGGERRDDPDWLRFHLLGATNPTYFALYARRRMELFGATEDDFAAVKVKNARAGAANPNARYRKEVTRRGGAGLADGGRPPAPAGDLRHLRRRGGPRAVEHGLRPPPRRRADTGVDPGGVDGHAPLSPDRHRDAQLRHRLRRGRGRGRRARLPPFHRLRRLRGGRASAPRTWTWPRSTTCRRPSSSTGTRTSGLCKEGEAERLLRDGDTALGGRIPVNPSGGLSSFGEAIPAQAIAQVCELVWQLRGQATGRQVEGARVGVTANQGLFGHGSSVIVTT